jgi:hypothetical protein
MSRIYGRKIISIYRNIRKINFRESPDVYGEFCDVDNGDVLRIIIKKKQRKSYEL